MTYVIKSDYNDYGNINQIYYVDVFNGVYKNVTKRFSTLGCINSIETIEVNTIIIGADSGIYIDSNYDVDNYINNFDSSLNLVKLDVMITLPIIIKSIHCNNFIVFDCVNSQLYRYHVTQSTTSVDSDSSSSNNSENEIQLLCSYDLQRVLKINTININQIIPHAYENYIIICTKDYIYELNFDNDDVRKYSTNMFDTYTVINDKCFGRPTNSSQLIEINYKSNNIDPKQIPFEFDINNVDEIYIFSVDSNSEDIFVITSNAITIYNNTRLSNTIVIYNYYEGLQANQQKIPLDNYRINDKLTKIKFVDEICRTVRIRDEQNYQDHILIQFCTGETYIVNSYYLMRINLVQFN